MASATCMLNWLIDSGSADVLDDMDHKHVRERSRLAYLPPEILQRVLEFFNEEQTALRIAFTCRRLYSSVIGNEHLWRVFYQKRFHQANDENDVRIIFSQCDRTINSHTILTHARMSSGHIGGSNKRSTRDNANVQSRNGYPESSSKHDSWFAKYASSSRLRHNWKASHSSLWRTRPLTDMGGRLPKHLRLLTANSHWALAASLAGAPTKLYLISLPELDTGINDDITRNTTSLDHLPFGTPIAYPLDWILDTDQPDDPIQRLESADMAVLSDTHVMVRIPITVERSATPCAIMVWRLSDRRLTRRLLFRRRNADPLHLLDRWLIFRKFDDHLQKDIDFICELNNHERDHVDNRARSSNITDNAALLEVDQQHLLHENANENANDEEVLELDEQEINNYGGYPPRMLFLPPDIGHFHCTSASISESSIESRNEVSSTNTDTINCVPLIYCCHVVERNQLQWSLMSLQSSRATVLHSSIVHTFEQEIYLKSSMRISDNRVLLTGTRRNAITGSFSTWLAVHHWKTNRLLFERGYPRSIWPDAATLIRSHGMRPLSTVHTLNATINSSTHSLSLSNNNASHTSLPGPAFNSMLTSHFIGNGHGHDSDHHGNTLITSLCQDTGPDLLAWLKFGELIVIDLKDGSIRYHFHHDMPSIGVFRPIVGSLYMLVDNGWRLLLDAATGWWQVIPNDDIYAEYELAGSNRLVMLRQGRLSFVEFAPEAQALMGQRSPLRSVFGALRSYIL
ncbi:hypothetical protein BDF22DRAFT_694504 [Syncephalis plumigaleata]|nr:hypothetical protein BDF22DRAFT_694504 [Syncephalis plumigaleata]